MPKGRYYPVGPEGEAQRQYGEMRPRISRRRINLDTARNSELVNLGGNSIWAVQASSFNAIIEIGFQEQGQGLIPFQKGTFVRVGPFSQIYITNSAQAGEWVDLVTVREESGEFEIQNPGSTFDTVQLVTPTAFDTDSDISIAAGSSRLVIGNNNQREEVIVQSHPDNTNRARIGPSSVSGSQGVILGPGESITLNTTAPIYAYNTNNTGDNSDTSISYVEVNE
jgi:hypothetical protein